LGINLEYQHEMENSFPHRRLAFQVVRRYNSPHPRSSSHRIPFESSLRSHVLFCWARLQSPRRSDFARDVHANSSPSSASSATCRTRRPASKATARSRDEAIKSGTIVPGSPRRAKSSSVVCSTDPEYGCRRRSRRNRLLPRIKSRP